MITLSGKRNKKKIYCNNCNLEITDLKTAKYCQSCRLKKLENKMKFNPSKEELNNKMIELKWNYCAVGRFYSVSDNAIRKKCKKYNI